MVRCKAWKFCQKKRKTVEERARRSPLSTLNRRPRRTMPITRLKTGHWRQTITNLRHPARPLRPSISMKGTMHWCGIRPRLTRRRARPDMGKFWLKKKRENKKKNKQLSLIFKHFKITCQNIFFFKTFNLHSIGYPQKSVISKKTSGNLSICILSWAPINFYISYKFLSTCSDVE